MVMIAACLSALAIEVDATLKMTPALAAGVSETLWSTDDLVALVDAHDAAKPRQKPGRKPKASPTD